METKRDLLDTLMEVYADAVNNGDGYLGKAQLEYTLMKHDLCLIDARDVISAPAQAAEVPDGYVLVPRKLTAENGAKGALTGEFSETFDYEDEDGIECSAEVLVSWTTIKAIHKKMVAHFDAAQPPAAPGETESNQLAAGTGPAPRDGLSPERSIPPHQSCSAGSDSAYQEEYTDILESENRKLKAELSELKQDIEKLKDPVAVHINTLRGGIARPSWSAIKHIYPEQFQIAAEPQAASDTDIERADAMNAGLNQEAFRKAWIAFQNTPIDILADSDDETCKCLSNAIRTFVAVAWKGRQS